MYEACGLGRYCPVAMVLLCTVVAGIFAVQLHLVYGLCDGIVDAVASLRSPAHEQPLVMSCVEKCKTGREPCSFVPKFFVLTVGVRTRVAESEVPQ